MLNSLLTYIATLKEYNFSNAGRVSFYAVLVQFSCASQLSCDLKSGNRLHKGLKIWYGEWLALHWIPVAYMYYMLGATTELSAQFLYHTYLVCILFGVPSLQCFTFIMFLF